MRIHPASFLVLSLFTLFPLRAQENPSKIGIGVSFNPTALFAPGPSSSLFLPIGFTNLYLPCNISPAFRLEPEAGIFSTSTNSSSQDPYSSYSSASSESMIRLGVGIFSVHTMEDGFSSYWGPRVGVLLNSGSSSSTGNPDLKSSETDLFAGLCLGGEFAFSPHFSLGAEVQVNYVSFGQPNVTPSTGLSSTRSEYIITNNGLVFVRWYY